MNYLKHFPQSLLNLLETADLSFSEALRRTRQIKEVTQEELANTIQVDRNTIHRWEKPYKRRGRMIQQIPEYVMVMKIITVLGCTNDEAEKLTKAWIASVLEENLGSEVKIVKMPTYLIPSGRNQTI